MMPERVTPGGNMLQMVHLLSTVAAVSVMIAISMQLSFFSKLPGSDIYAYEPAGDKCQACKQKLSRSFVGVTTRGDKPNSEEHRIEHAALPDKPRQSKAKRVALAFYGLTRSLKYTIPSIKSNILEKLRDSGIDYDVYLHTYNLTGLQNERSGESSKLNVTEWQLLNPDYVKVTSQERFLRDYELSIKACQTFSYGSRESASAVDYYEDGFRSMQNLMCQLNSIETVTSMWRASNQTYDAILYLRPDMLYNCPLPVKEIENLQEGKVYVADFHHWHGINDRFAMGRPDAVGHWGERLQFALSSCMRKQIHAEVLVSSLLDHYQLEPVKLPFYFFRVRSNGLLEDRDFQPKWKRFEVPRCDEKMFEPFTDRAKETSENNHSEDPEIGKVDEKGVD